MIIEEMMKTEVQTLTEEDTIEEALRILNAHHIRHIPIVDKDDQVIGIVSDRDVRDASPSVFEQDPQLNQLRNRLGSIMTSPVITVHPLDFVEEVATIFYEHEIACVPVTSNEKLVGIITEKDLLYTLIQLTGTNVQSSQIEVKVPNRPGMLPGVVDIVGNRKLNISSILIYPYKPDNHYKVIVFRVQTMNPNPIIDELRAADYEVLWPKAPGLSL
ncbi:acetoin utilization AcuB family protein [Salimicrobium halophilum]|uniref:Acetoin utilization protein AcuB n=1 Tax=Salimicrobium halophilum TaxID=86666 RepID=A0A1G8VJL5_9BACI|nr:acetoin utilization AcuB family protein [Salimicrobium halophilum]SDJ66306.1 acetoin utilization protein AcuB [Salimicrobium halophilum]